MSENALYHNARVFVALLSKLLLAFIYTGWYLPPIINHFNDKVAVHFPTVLVLATLFIMWDFTINDLDRMKKRNGDNDD